MSIIRVSLHRVDRAKHRGLENSAVMLIVPIAALLLLSGAVSALDAADAADELSANRETAAARGVLSPAVPRYVIGAGGGRSGGGVYGIQGTIGQPDAEPIQPSSGGPYAITGGFWPGLTSATAWWLFGDGFEGSAD